MLSQDCNHYLNRAAPIVDEGLPSQTLDHQQDDAVALAAVAPPASTRSGQEFVRPGRVLREVGCEWGGGEAERRLGARQLGSEGEPACDHRERGSPTSSDGPVSVSPLPRILPAANPTAYSLR
jgi:hypothetical protein